MQNTMTTMTVREARDNFSDLLGAVFYGKKAVSIEKKGRVFAVVVNPDDYQSLKQSAKQRFFSVVGRIQRKNKNVDAASATREIDSAVDEVRSENYEKNK